ncbi:MAG: hypothetical protein A3I62_03110 [Betaproteobacteria bacterium RIFCSPLOWO2_02_FULL_62_79]|nr:MAG: hypothetical protein A3I62_03110 [Betaproteobacteria bacterium RIFCSPLOWO2_02_FULL_62_79]
MARIRIAWQSGEVTANLRATPAAQNLLAALPCESTANTWGDEVYFSLPVKVKLEADAQQVVDAGTVCFWVEGSSLALPFGPTPVSKGGECRLVTRCNVLGMIEGDARRLKSVRDGEAIRVELLEK